MKKFCLLIVLVLCSSSIFSQEELTLQNAIEIALQRNPVLIKTTNNIVGYEANVKSSYGDLFPSLGIRGSWNWSKTKDKGGTQTDFFGNTTELPASEVDSRTYSLSAGGSVTLFDGLANYANISRSEDALEAAKYDLMKLKQDIVLQTTIYYYDVISAEELLRVRDENVKYNEKLLEQINERNRLGSVPKADVYTQEVQLGNARVQYISQQNSFENAKNTLLTYLALDVLKDYTFFRPTDIQTKADIDAYLEKFGPIENMIKEAFTNRFDYKSQLLYLENTYDDLKIARGGYYPSLSGSYGFSSSAVKPADLLDRKVYSAGLTLSLPIFANFNISTNVQYAEIGVKNAEEDLSTLERRIRVEIKQGWLDVLAAKEALLVSYESVKSATENRRINDERYALGAGTILDVLQATRDYQDAQQNLISSVFYFYTTHDRLLNLMGQLEFKKYENIGE
jgi:outer membrane protein